MRSSPLVERGDETAKTPLTIRERLAFVRLAPPPTFGRSPSP